MTPDELRALPPAERLPHLRSLYLAFLDWPEEDPAPNFEGRLSIALLALDAADEVARDHAALLKWAERAAEEMRQQADRDMSDFFTITFDWHDEHIGNGEESAEDCVVCRLNALLAEWAEMQERPS